MSEKVVTALLPRHSRRRKKEDWWGPWAKKGMQRCFVHFSVPVAEAGEHLQALFHAFVQSTPGSRIESVQVPALKHGVSHSYENLAILGVHDLRLADNDCM